MAGGAAALRGVVPHDDPLLGDDAHAESAGEAVDRALLAEAIERTRRRRDRVDLLGRRLSTLRQRLEVIGAGYSPGGR